MIIEMIINTVFIAIEGLINMLPANTVETIVYSPIPDAIKWGAYFFPLDTLVFAIGMFLTWYTILMAWAVIEWVYKKIPGVS